MNRQSRFDAGYRMLGAGPRGWKNPESDSSDISPRLLHLLQQQQQHQQQRCLWPWGRASKQGDVPTVASGNAVCEHFIC